MTADPFGTGEAFDQWDGFPEDRTRLLGAIEQAGLRDVVFITGDAHVFMCSLLGTDFPAIGSDPNRVPAAVEYIGGSVTSPGLIRPEAEARARRPVDPAVQRRRQGLRAARRRRRPARHGVPLGAT